MKARRLRVQETGRYSYDGEINLRGIQTMIAEELTLEKSRGSERKIWSIFGSAHRRMGDRK